MYQRALVSPFSAKVEEQSLELAGTVAQVGQTIDARDWFGATKDNFGNNRVGAFMMWDIAAQLSEATGSATLTIEYGLPTLPLAEPPVLTFTPSPFGALVLPSPTGTWVHLSVRVPAAFARVSLARVSGPDPATAYYSLNIRTA